MNLRIFLLLLLFVGLAGMTAGCMEEGGDAGSTETMAEETEVSLTMAATTIRSSFGAAVAEGSGTAAATLYTADAKTYRPDGGMGSGAEEVAATYQEMFQIGINAVTLEPYRNVGPRRLGMGAWQLPLHRAIE